MNDKIEELKEKVKNFSIENRETLENFRTKFLSKKGELNEIFEAFKLIAGVEKKDVGQKINSLRTSIEDKFNEAKEKFKTQDADLVEDWVKEAFKKHPLFELEYFIIADESALIPIILKEKSKKYRAFIAVIVNNIRLIDTITLN